MSGPAEVNCGISYPKASHSLKSPSGMMIAGCSGGSRTLPILLAMRLNQNSNVFLFPGVRWEKVAPALLEAKPMNPGGKCQLQVCKVQNQGLNVGLAVGRFLRRSLRTLCASTASGSESWGSKSVGRGK